MHAFLPPRSLVSRMDGVFSLPHLSGSEPTLRQTRIAETDFDLDDAIRRTREHTARVSSRKAYWRCAISSPLAATAISR
jgi:hypothetical protein